MLTTQEDLRYNYFISEKRVIAFIGVIFILKFFLRVLSIFK